MGPPSLGLPRLLNALHLATRQRPRELLRNVLPKPPPARPPAVPRRTRPQFGHRHGKNVTHLFARKTRRPLRRVPLLYHGNPSITSVVRPHALLQTPPAVPRLRTPRRHRRITFHHHTLIHFLPPLHGMFRRHQGFSRLLRQ